MQVDVFRWQEIRNGTGKYKGRDGDTGLELPITMLPSLNPVMSKLCVKAKRLFFFDFSKITRI